MTISCLGSRQEIKIVGMFFNSFIVTTAELIQAIFKNTNYTHTSFLLRRNKKVICISSRKAMKIIFSAKIKTLLGSWLRVIRPLLLRLKTCVQFPEPIY